MKTFSERLKFALDVRGKSQHALARSLGVEQGAISNFARGKRETPAYMTVSRIARALDISVEWLGEGRGRPPSKDERLDPLPKREEAARIAREGGLPSHAIEYVLSHPVTPEVEHYTTLQWITAIQLASSLPTMAPPSPPPGTPPLQSLMRPRADTPPSTRRSTETKK